MQSWCHELSFPRNQSLACVIYWVHSRSSALRSLYTCCSLVCPCCSHFVQAMHFTWLCPAVAAFSRCRMFLISAQCLVPILPSYRNRPSLKASRLRRQRCRTLAKSTWQKMTVTFGSRELASRKWSDSCLFAENLKRLLQKTRCVNCTKMFVVDDNNDEACHYHPGPTQTALRNQNHLDRIIFHCCGGEQVGFSPVLYECPPCKVGRHVSAEEKEDQQKAGAKKWRIRESIIRVREFKALILICLYDHLTCFVVEKCHTLKLSVQKINVWKQWEAIESA